MTKFFEEETIQVNQPTTHKENTLKPSTLATIADGAAVELFQHELGRIAKNIADPNTKPTATRKITLTFEFKPDEGRDEVHCTVNAKSQIAHTRGYSKTVYTGKVDGKPTLLAADQRQTDLFTEGVRQIDKPQAVI